MKVQTQESATRLDSQRMDTCIEQIANQDKEALRDLYQMASASVFGFALSILKNTQDAEDVLQDVYLRIYTSATGYQTTGKPVAWILTITRNLCLMKLRERKRTADRPQEDWSFPVDRFPSVTAEDRMVLAACMKHLSDEESQIIMLHAVSGYKHREIADALSLPLSTVLSKYRRALKKLKVLLTEEESK